MPIDYKPTEAMAAEARRGLEWREKNNRGGTEVGVARARDISNRRNLSPETINRMVSYFARHEVDKKGQGFSPNEEGYPSAGRIAWALWGGDAGKSWANEKQRQIKTESENEMHIEITNKQGKVKLNEVVTRESIGRMIDEISKLFGAKAVAEGADFGEIMNVAENAVDVLDIEINSPGGSVFDGYTVYQEIKSLQDRGVVVNATITGMAASMASVICMACDKVSIVPHGRMMIHDASSGFAGNAEQMRKQADLLDSISSDIANIYSSRTKKPVEDIRAMMKKETWMDAKTTVANGFADEIAEKKQPVSNTLTEGLDILAEKENKQPMSILSKLFPNNDQVAQVESAIQENDSLRAEIADLQSKLESAKEADQTIIENTLKINDLTAKLDEAKNEIESVKSELVEAQAKITAAAESAGEQAIEMLASIGQAEALPIENGGEQRSILEQFESLKGSEATAFYKEHSKAIKAELKKRK